MKRRLLTSVLCSIVGLNAMLAAGASRPKLVVGIVIDQLRTDYIEYLRGLFTTGGFNRLADRGTYMRDVRFDAAGLDIASATAMVMTGNYPSQTGVPAAQSYSLTHHKPAATLADPQAMGNFTSEAYSPAALRLSTIADEVAIDGAGLAAVHAIATDPQQAVILAGHAANSAVWLNLENGKWATTTYYKEVPQPVNRRNYEFSLPSRIDTMQWKPMLPLDRYPGIPAQKRHYPFRYMFPQRDKDAYSMFAASPLANREVTDIAIDYLRALKLGNRGDAIDMLGIGYSAAPFKYVKDGDFRLELEDSYLRLDAQLARLLDAIDKYVGLGNALVFVSSTGYYNDATPDDPRYRIPSGDFSTKRALSLLNSYLSARYGNGDYTEAFFGPRIFLNHKTLDSHKLDAVAVAREAAAFLCRMAGVADAVTVTDIISGTSPSPAQIRRSVDAKTPGDIYVTFHPGWNVVDDLHYPVQTTPVRSSMVASPAFIMGPGVGVRTIGEPVDATTLAPTVTQALRIRSPNGAAGRPHTL